MALSPPQRRELKHWLGTIYDDEMDCERFLAALAELVDGGIEDERMQKLMHIHAEMCPECAEEHALLVKALGR